MDAYLYAFILGLAGVIDSLGEDDERRNVTLGFGLLAATAGFCNFLTMDDHIAGHPVVGSSLRAFAWILLLVVFLGYGSYKLLALYGAAAEDWEENEESTVTVGKEVAK
jgi:hypothetical protein